MKSILVNSKFLVFMLCGLLWGGTTFADVSTDHVAKQNVIFTDIAGEYYHFLALDNGGNVWGWGDNISYQLGDIPQSYRVAPVKIKGITDVKRIATGVGHSTAVKSDGTVWVWGQNLSGVFGQDPEVLQFAKQPIQVKGINDVVAISGSAYYTLVLKKDGTVWGWGRNSEGQLGIGHVSEYETIPVQVSKLTHITAIYTSFYESYALTSDGTVWHWGNLMKCGEMCSPSPSSTPSLLEGLQNVNKISDAIAILQDGTVMKWGSNYLGGLGNGTMDNVYAPIPFPLSDLKNIVGVSRTHVVDQEGHVWAWGENNYGQVGDGTKQSYPKPIELKGIDQVAAITSGQETTVALTKDGELYEWGNNNRGQIANVEEALLPPTPVPFVQPQINYTLPVPRDPSTWTFLDDKGRPIKDYQLYLRVKPFSEGYAAVQRANNELWTFIDAHGNPAILYDYSLVKDFHQGRAAVKVQDGWHFINATGQFINQEHYSNVDSFANGLAPVKIASKWGYIGLDGKLKVKPQFDVVRSFNNGMAAVQINGKWGYIDPTGKVVIKAAYSAAGPFIGQAAVKQNGKWGYISKSGAWSVKPKFDDAKPFSSSNLAPVKVNGKWGYMNLTGKFVIAAQYDDASPYQGGLASVKKNGYWAIIDSKGKLLTPFQFVEVQPYNNKVAWAATATDNGYLDSNGKWIYKDKIQTKK